MRGLERAIDLGRLEAIRRDRGDLVLLRRLLRFALFRTVGRAIYATYRRRRREFQESRRRRA